MLPTIFRFTILPVRFDDPNNTKLKLHFLPTTKKKLRDENWTHNNPAETVFFVLNFF